MCFKGDGYFNIKGNGDNYILEQLKVLMVMELKFHTNPSDPQFGLPWMEIIGLVGLYRIIFDWV
jgi:hypothetical protein